MRLCKCGCGNEVKFGNKYIHGHNRAGVVSYTSGNKWSMDYERCKECGSISFSHAGKGLCSMCYKKYFYQAKKDGIGKWARKYKKCVKCKTTDLPHKAKGLCISCYDKKSNRKKGIRVRNFGAWSWYYDKCIKCSTIKIAHAANGLCYDCFEMSKRDLSKCVPCPVCGVLVESLNQVTR